MTKRINSNYFSILVKAGKDEWSMNKQEAKQQAETKTVSIQVSTASYRRMEFLLNWAKPCVASLFLLSFFITATGYFDYLLPGSVSCLLSLIYFWLSVNFIPADNYSSKLSCELSPKLKPLFEEVGVQELEYASPDPALPSFFIKKIAGNYLVFIPSEVKTKFDFDCAKSAILTLVTEELASIKQNSKRQRSWL